MKLGLEKSEEKNVTAARTIRQQVVGKAYAVKKAKRKYIQQFNSNQYNSDAIRFFGLQDPKHGTRMITHKTYIYQ